MLRYVEEFFAGRRAALKVVGAFLRLGIRVDEAGKLYCESIELAPAKVARALSVDRRVVIETAREIASDPQLYPVFSGLLPIANVERAAKFFGHDVIEIGENPCSMGVVAKVTGILAKNKVNIRQIIADDPDLYPEPRLRIVIDGRLPQKALLEVRKLGLQSISLK
ncbi:MAG: amino acid-binding ACT domain protein [Candidatus Micrarchaeota archaeon]|nr:amino acid-binding ACT domain protein [Candidatus Micrarchaeota archaeon]